MMTWYYWYRYDVIWWRTVLMPTRTEQWKVFNDYQGKPERYWWKSTVTSACWYVEDTRTPLFCSDAKWKRWLWNLMVKRIDGERKEGMTWYRWWNVLTWAVGKPTACRTGKSIPVGDGSGLTCSELILLLTIRVYLEGLPACWANSITDCSGVMTWWWWAVFCWRWKNRATVFGYEEAWRNGKQTVPDRYDDDYDRRAGIGDDEATALWQWRVLIRGGWYWQSDQQTDAGREAGDDCW